MERLKFDPRSYTSELDADKLAVNFADIAIEARVGPVRQRVNPYRLVVQPDGRVINPDLGDADILTLYRNETSLDRRETEAASVIRESLINDPPGTMAVWFSPQSPQYGYLEGRITVGYSRMEEGIKDMQSYGFPVVDREPYDLLDYARNLAEFSERSYKLFDPEDLRSTPIIFQLTKNEDPWEFLSKHLPFPDVWEAIQNDEVSELRQKAFDASRQVARGVIDRILKASSLDEQMVAIKYGIDELSYLGMEIDMDKLVCSVNVSGTSFAYSNVSTGEGGAVVEGPFKFVKNCGSCGRPINEFICKGYKCSCGGVYEGC